MKLGNRGRDRDDSMMPPHWHPQQEEAPLAPCAAKAPASRQPVLGRPARALPPRAAPADQREWPRPPHLELSARCLHGGGSGLIKDLRRKFSLVIF